MKIGDKDMKSNKGQALVEFVIILPITLILIFCVIDFGRIISLKSDLESKILVPLVKNWILVKH